MGNHYQKIHNYNYFLHRNSGAEINRYFYKSGSSEPILLTEKMNKHVDIRDKNKLRSEAKRKRKREQKERDKERSNDKNKKRNKKTKK